MTPLWPKRGHAEDHRGDDRDLVALEDVGRHAGAVADVVADVVGDRRGVARVVLGDVLLDLADEVGADVGGLRVDAAADAHEEREERAAEAEAEERLVGLLAEDQEDDRAAEEAEAVGQHAGDRARPVAELHRLAVARPRGRGDPEVAGRGEAHPDEADGPGEERADEERARAPPAEGRLAPGVGEEEEERQDDDERPDPLELRREVGVRAFPDGGRHFLHLRRPGVGREDLPRQVPGVEEARDRDGRGPPSAPRSRAACTAGPRRARRA